MSRNWFRVLRAGSWNLAKNSSTVLLMMSGCLLNRCSIVVSSWWRDTVLFPADIGDHSVHGADEHHQPGENNARKRQLESGQIIIIQRLPEGHRKNPEPQHEIADDIHRGGRFGQPDRHAEQDEPKRARQYLYEAGVDRVADVY